MASTVEIDNLGLPPLAGVCSYERAARPGLDVEQTVTRLKRYNYIARRLHEAAAAHLPSTPEWEVKCGLGLHLWLDAEHCGGIRARVAEMREPPLHLDDVPDERLRAALEELIRAEDPVELLAGIYGVMRPALVVAVQEHLELVNPLFDHPTYRLLRSVLQEQEEMLDWGRSALSALTTSAESASRATAFTEHVGHFLAMAGGPLGEEPRPAVDGEAHQPRWDGTDYVMNAEPRRDERFIDPFNDASDIYARFQDDSAAPDERAYALAYKRLVEMDVPEWMAPILFTTKGKPWEYYRDLSRQLWDETRHTMMGEVALYYLGVPFYAYPITMISSTSLNREFTPLEAHLILWYIEQGLMPRETGKRREWEVARLAGDPFFVALQDYDWADEVLHAQIGRRWLEAEFPDPSQRKAIAAELHERWLGTYDRYQGRSSQRDWWPDFLERARAGRADASVHP